jgi:hypothetical protein
VTDFPKSCVDALAAYLLANVAGISKVYSEWPNKNQTLSYPSISITSGKMNFRRCPPRVLSIGSVANNQATNKYVVGDYDPLTLQLDIWARNKPERADFYEKVFALLQPAAQQGLALQLTNYHNEIVSFHLTGYRYADAEQTATLQEWRAILSLEAAGRAIVSQTDYVITQEPVLTFDMPSPDTEIP